MSKAADDLMALHKSRRPQKPKKNHVIITFSMTDLEYKNLQRISVALAKKSGSKKVTRSAALREIISRCKIGS